MKIDDKTLTYEINRYVSEPNRNNMEQIGERHSCDDTSVEGMDQAESDAVVSISSASKEVSRIKEIIASEPDVREDKVSALKEKIESGDYEIDNKAVGEKLVETFLDEISYS